MPSMREPTRLHKPAVYYKGHVGIWLCTVSTWWLSCTNCYVISKRRSRNISEGAIRRSFESTIDNMEGGGQCTGTR